MLVSLSAVAGVGARGSPVNTGPANGARLVSVGCTWSARENVTATPGAATPSIIGLALLGKAPPPATTAAATNAVVAIDVSLSPGEAVGAVGLPVNAGEANGANDVAKRRV